MPYSRRSFLKAAAVASYSLPLLASCLPARRLNHATDELDVSIFSKHLQFLDYQKTGQIAAELGFNGVDLTVRPKGHVLPENVSKDLPAAIRDINNAGSSCKMITTSIEAVSNPHDVEIIKTAGSNGVSFYRTNWYKYGKGLSMTESLEKYQAQVYELGLLNKEHGIVGCYQNHAGTSIGSSFWEIHKLLEKVDPQYFGTQYDIRHATVDGGYSWKNGLELLHKQIKAIVLKDFKWGKENGKWKAVNVPIGEGMVDFHKYFQLLKGYGLNPPVSLHLEYPLGGAEKGHYSITVDQKVVFDAMRKDLVAIRKLWKEA